MSFKISTYFLKYTLIKQQKSKLKKKNIKKKKKKGTQLIYLIHVRVRQEIDLIC